MDSAPKVKRVLYELSTAFTPELSPDEVMSRMVMTVKVALQVDRVGLFVLSEDRRSMVLKASGRSKGVRLPIRGLAGAVLQSDAAVNIADAYLDPRFDVTMDRRTGYRTRQVLGVPLRHPLSLKAMGLLQVTNKLDGALDSFSAEQQRVLELAAEQLSELLLGRADVFIYSGVSAWPQSLGQGVGDGLSLINSADVYDDFHLHASALVLGAKALEVVAREGLVSVELQASLHLALSHLCDTRYALLDLAGSDRQQAQPVRRAASTHLTLEERMSFDISVRDLPRATRILFKLYGWRKKRAGASSGSSATAASSLASNSSSNAGRVALGWAACTLYDFKGCMDTVQELFFFPELGASLESEVQVPIATTLSNNRDASLAALSILLTPDLVLAESSYTPRVRIVHSLPPRSEPDSSSSNNGNSNSSSNSLKRSSPEPPFKLSLSEPQLQELERILQLSFNPLSTSMLSASDKELLWELRHALVTKPELLPAFAMSVAWNRAERVRELYELLELWAQPSSVQALQLLDRRFMDLKVRAYAVHCLEDLPDKQLALYMLQLCQQLKFESFVDSALARFLLRRALTNSKLIGHIYFWLLQSEVCNPDVAKRYIVLLQVYIRNCGKHRVELGHQMFVMRRLERVAEAVKQGKSKEARKKILRDKLAETVLPAAFKLPLNPHLTVSTVLPVASQCCAVLCISPPTACLSACARWWVSM
jgi:hypothetical protein